MVHQIHHVTGSPTIKETGGTGGTLRDYRVRPAARSPGADHGAPRTRSRSPVTGHA